MTVISEIHPTDYPVTVRWPTYIALKRIRQDRSYPTFDMIVRDLIERAYPGQYDLG